MKNGDQHKTKVKNTNPSTLEAFCSVATEPEAKVFRFTLPARNLERRFRGLVNFM